MNEEKIRKALNHAFTQGVMVGIGQTEALNTEKGRDARAAKLATLMDATISEMRRNTKGLLTWLGRKDNRNCPRPRRSSGAGA